MREVEVTLRGTITQQDGTLLLISRGQKPPVPLKPLQAYEKIQWNHREREYKPLEPSEAGAYNTLVAAVADLAPEHEVTVTGPLKRAATGYDLHIRSSNI